jgi:hypothetical protein
MEEEEVPLSPTFPPSQGGREEKEEDILEIFNKTLSGQENVIKLQVIMTEL